MARNKTTSTQYIQTDIHVRDEKRIQRIEKGLEKDNFTNHFYSHFGFLDKNRTLSPGRWKAVSGVSISHGTSTKMDNDRYRQK